MLPGLRYERLGKQEAGWIGGPASVDRAPDDLIWMRNARVFVTPPPSNLDTLTRIWFETAGLPMPRLSVCNSLAAIVELVQADSGIGILPFPMVARHIAADIMHRLCLPGKFLPQRIFFAYSRGVFNASVGDILRNVQAVVREQVFCDVDEGSFIL